VTGILVRPGVGVWLHAGIGIIHISQAEVDKVVRDPSYAVKVELFDTLSDLPDQLHTRISGVPVTTAVESSDGLLWFMTSRGIARVDPRGVLRNPLAPPVWIRAVIADDRPYDWRGGATLPARTKTIQIDYTALSLAIPERVEFRYRLEGWETDWHDAGSRRSAFYTQLGSGDYRFRVIASNNDGVWNETGATVPFTIATPWFQTWWFQSLVTLSALAVLWGIYQLRVRQLAASMSARFDGRLTERTRIARDLHDTLLQTVQGSKMIADEALRNAQEPHDKRALEQLSEWLGQAVLEGRAALNSLRISSVSLTDLAQALREAAESIPMVGRPMPVSVSVYGRQRKLHPAIREDIFRIAYEAMRNACAHSKGTQVSVAIECGHDLNVRVTDNGIGIDPTVSAEGKAGHFGLRGMYERAADIGATLEVLSSIKGTSIVVTVPGRVAVRDDATHSGAVTPSRHERD
jgi:signal transduction histidine kinase